MPTRTVNLGNKGLQTGDDIAPYLDSHWNSGTEVLIPAGQYTLGSNSSFSFDGSDSILRGVNGEARLMGRRRSANPNLMARGGTVTIRNVTIHNDPSLGGFDIGVFNGARLEFLNFNMPDGHTPQYISTDTLPAFLNRGHANGTVVWDSCNLFGHSDNCIYTGQSQNCKNIIRNCWFRRNNIDQVRVGGAGDVVEQNLIEMPTRPPADADGGRTGRGIRVRYDGSATIQNNRITYEANTSDPIVIVGDGNVTIRNNDIYSVTQFAMRKTGSSSASVSGGGNVLTGPTTELNAPLSGLYSSLVDCPPRQGGDGSQCPRMDDPREPLGTSSPPDDGTDGGDTGGETGESEAFDFATAAASFGLVWAWKRFG